MSPFQTITDFIPYEAINKPATVTSPKVTVIIKMPAQTNPNLISHFEVCNLMGYKNPGDAEKKLREQGITPIYGKSGYFFIAIHQLIDDDSNDENNFKSII